MAADNDPVAIKHYSLDSANPEWLREMIAWETNPELPAPAHPDNLEAVGAYVVVALLISMALMFGCSVAAILVHAGVIR